MNNSELKKEFLISMRGVASTVNVISSQYEDAKHAMTASSVVSLSLDPPSMLVCVNKEASIHQVLDKERFFLTYGDGLSNVNLKKLLNFHKKKKKINNSYSSEADSKIWRIRNKSQR